MSSLSLDQIQLWKETNCIPCQDAIETTFMDVRDLMWHTVHRFAKRRGLPVKEFSDNIPEWFFIAMMNYRVVKKDQTATIKKRWSKSSFESYLVHVILTGCLDIVRNHARRASIIQWRPLTGYETYRLPFQYELLSNDSKLVVDLVLDTPRGLARIIKAEGDKPEHYRKCIREYLDGVGWAASRIAKSFSEISEALK